MPFWVFATVLLAAALHASWNAVVKSGDDKVLTTIMVAASASVTAAMVLPFLASPARPCWPFIASSVLIHIVYFALVGSAYRVGDMGQVYPLMRGTAPFLVALASVSAFGEKLSIPAWMGVGLICVGIITMVKEGKAGNVRGIYLALLNAIVIASYTLIDGAGTRLSAAPTAYAAWVFMLTGPPLMAWALFTKREAFVAVARSQWRTGVFGGSRDRTLLCARARRHDDGAYSDGRGAARDVNPLRDCNSRARLAGASWASALDRRWPYRSWCCRPASCLK